MSLVNINAKFHNKIKGIIHHIQVVLVHKLDPITEGQGETEERRRAIQMGGRWQV